MEESLENKTDFVTSKKFVPKSRYIIYEQCPQNIQVNSFYFQNGLNKNFQQKNVLTNY